MENNIKYCPDWCFEQCSDKFFNTSCKIYGPLETVIIPKKERVDSNFPYGTLRHKDCNKKEEDE